MPEGSSGIGAMVRKLTYNLRQSIQPGCEAKIAATGAFNCLNKSARIRTKLIENRNFH